MLVLRGLRMGVLFVTLLTSSVASAFDGLHLLVGAGLNSSVFTSNTEREAYGIGLNLRTDLGYYFSRDFGIELGSNVNFNKADSADVLVWDTLLTLGLRARLPFLPHSEKRVFYGKIFGGYGPAVTYFNGDRPSNVNGEAERAHLHGPVGGASLGISRRTEGGRVWFIELTGTVHRFLSIEMVRSEKDVPIIVDHWLVQDNSTLTSIYLSAGLVLF